MTKSLALYKSKFEHSTMKITKEKDSYFMWIYVNKKLISFDNLKKDKERMLQLYKWFKNKETEGVCLSKSLGILDAKVEALEAIVRGNTGRKTEKVKM